MRFWILFLLAMTNATATRAIDADGVVGTWRLASATRKIVESGEVIDAYGGPNPTGWLTYGKDGRMMVICAFENRRRPEANDKMSDQDRIELHKTFFAYAGTYKIDSGKIVHNIDTSWNEVWSGTSQSRQIEQTDDGLVLTTPPFKFNVDGKLSIITLVWKKHSKVE
jgi:hypothetical protein